MPLFSKKSLCRQILLLNLSRYCCRFEASRLFRNPAFAISPVQISIRQFEKYGNGTVLD